jgi:hypothetical protein
MLFGPANYDYSFLNGKQKFSGFFGIIASFIYPLSDVAILIRDLIKKEDK